MRHRGEHQRWHLGAFKGIDGHVACHEHSHDMPGSRKRGHRPCPPPTMTPCSLPSGPSISPRHHSCPLSPLPPLSPWSLLLLLSPCVASVYPLCLPCVAPIAPVSPLCRPCLSFRPCPLVAPRLILCGDGQICHLYRHIMEMAQACHGDGNPARSIPPQPSGHQAPEPPSAPDYNRPRSLGVKLVP